ncbi:FAD binding domain protein [Anaerofustis stercorihominis DSM 17244]|uniref:L-aspartate oxidase n=1 Tax=Anaerofustis stercorihominis DSM 17244 TaxID=445971 RepID=B1CBJ8_9FIRM|nr:L-aspartate oxidase [Anaerofustis stercorihominis]EDS71645.1 FAD binding domain protein [Anaerofustis stercorihominis DSM 17244]
MELKTDIVIVGTGAAGLFSALNLPEDKNITIITKDEAENSDSFLAQGGICVLKDENDYKNYFEDTMKAGHYENDKKSVEIMINSSKEIIKDLEKYKVDFQKDNGEYVFTREGAHSSPRILFHKDITGREITSKLLNEVKKRNNIKIMEQFTMVDIINKNNECYGIIGIDKKGSIVPIKADYTIFACGGIGGLFDNSTNFPHITADAIAIAINNNIKLKNIDYIQIHPTTLYSKKKGRRFLISESVRGEGAVLLNKNMERFANELLPRDILTKKILEQMKKDNMPYVWLSMEPIDKKDIKNHFPNIYEHCLKEGYDVTKECIPVVPSQHYFMGGIKVDYNSKTSMENLYAVGETSCNGVHGKNRLASNSLLESLVFAKRAAKDITKENKKIEDINLNIDLSKYKDYNKLQKSYRQIVLDEIERKKKDYERSNHNEA